MKPKVDQYFYVYDKNEKLEWIRTPVPRELIKGFSDSEKSHWIQIPSNDKDFFQTMNIPNKHIIDEDPTKDWIIISFKKEHVVWQRLIDNKGKIWEKIKIGFEKALKHFYILHGYYKKWIVDSLKNIAIWSKTEFYDNLEKIIKEKNDSLDEFEENFIKKMEITKIKPIKEKNDSIAENYNYSKLKKLTNNKNSKKNININEPIIWDDEPKDNDDS